MSKEFQYKQRKTTDSYRKGWEKVFNKWLKDEDDYILSGNSKETPTGLIETTEQKQP